MIFDIKIDENAKQNKILCFQRRKKLTSETMNTVFAFFTANSDLVHLVSILNEKIPRKAS